jgi:hypothetical protein
MNLSSIVSSYGSSALDVLVERLTMSGVVVRNAWLRPVSDPLSERIDVTGPILDIMRETMMIIDETLDPRDLISAAKCGSHGRRTMTWFEWMTTSSAAHVSHRPSMSLPPGDDVVEYWLCICFALPGDASFVSCHRIPSEPVTFPPCGAITASRGCMMPICRQIISAAIEFSGVDGAEEEGEPDDDDDGGETVVTVLDITRHLRMMLGPEGDAFGRGTADVSLAMAEAMDDGRMTRVELADRIVGHMLKEPGPTVHGVIVRTADGETRAVVKGVWVCPDQSSFEERKDENPVDDRTSSPSPPPPAIVRCDSSKKLCRTETHAP